MATDDRQPDRRLDVEAIVREVVARLNSVAKSSSAAPAAASHTAASAGELVIAGRVVTAAALDGRLVAITRVVVERGAVVTPAARDLLNDKKITLETVALKSGGAKVARRLVIGVAETRFAPVDLVRYARSLGAEVEETPRVGLTSVVDELCDRVAGSGYLGLLLTGEAPAAACLANRHRGVRAATAASLDDVAEAVSSVAVNLLVADPARTSVFALRQMTKSFLTTGGGPCPALLSERLS